MAYGSEQRKSIGCENSRGISICWPCAHGSQYPCSFLKNEFNPDGKEQKTEIKKIQALYKEMYVVQSKDPKRIRKEDCKEG
jgi:hypothetical protein